MASCCTTLASCASAPACPAGQKVGVLHGIVNADIDELCAHLNNLPLPVQRKVVAQPAIRAALVGSKVVFALAGLGLLRLVWV